MSAMFQMKGRTTVDDSIILGIEGEVARDIVPVVAAAARRLAVAMRRNVGRSYPPASKPGEFPAKVQGFLQGAIGWSTAKQTGRAVTAFVGAGAGKEGRAGGNKAKAAGVNVYAEANSLEYGSVDKKGNRRAPRPWLRPTMNQMESEIVRMLERG